jgi:hypothetical protein
MAKKKKPVEFNINSTVLVKITPSGREKIMENRRHTAKYLHQQAAAQVLHIIEDADGWSRWQLWGLMQEFGHMLRSGQSSPFETTIRLAPELDDEDLSAETRVRLIP